MTPELKAKLEACRTLPSPPGVATRIITLANDPAAGIQDVAKVMALDPAITSKVLRLANSPLYARRGKVSNIRDAVVVLGLNATISLALSFSLVKSWQDDEKRDSLDYPQFWRRALLNATIGRALAQQLGLRNGEELFLTCLLQDIGMLALARALPDLYADVSDQARHDEVVRAERDRLGVEHAAVGGWLLKCWNFPERIEQGVAGSHDPSRIAVVHPNATFVRCVHVAGLIAEHFLVSSHERSVSSSTAQQALGMSRAQLDEVIRAVTHMVPEMERVFETSILETGESESILDDAREALLLRNLQTLQVVSQLRDQTDSLEARTKELEDSSRRDELTGLFNRRYLDSFLAAAFRYATDTRAPLSVAFADLDGFKGVNDRHGHQAGDQVLVTTARLLQCNVRSSDIVARYGGEEFVLVFPETDSRTVLAICERVVQACERAQHPLESGATFNVTISIGTATLDDTGEFKSFPELVAAADKALYAAKLAGRNRTVQFDRVA
jgi:diguanylate cyclase (GGDEF)-like protein